MRSASLPASFGDGPLLDALRVLRARGQLRPRPRARKCSPTRKSSAFVCAIKARYGLAQVRLTGGEPLVRPGVEELVAMLAAAGVADIALTTNGQRLAEMAGPLRQAGLNRINISLDSLNPATFAAITRGGILEKTLAGIAAARERRPRPRQTQHGRAARSERPRGRGPRPVRDRARLPGAFSRVDADRRGRRRFRGIFRVQRRSARATGTRVRAHPVARRPSGHQPELRGRERTRPDGDRRFHLAFQRAVLRGLPAAAAHRHRRAHRLPGARRRNPSGPARARLRSWTPRRCARQSIRRSA